MLRTHAAVLATILLVAAVTPAASAVIHVPGDQPTIQEGVNVAGKGDTVLVAAGTYSGELNRDIDFGGINTVLLAPAGPKYTTINGLGSTRAFDISSGEDTTSVIEGFTVKNGHSDLGGGFLCDGASPTIRNCVFEANRSSHRGGALACVTASPVIVNCEFVGNSSELAYDGEGGAVYCGSGSSVVFRECLFRSNSSDMGAAVVCSGSSFVRLTRCLCAGNAADAGGALACRSSSSMAVEQCTLTGNISVSGTSVCCDGGSTVDATATIMAFGWKGTAVLCWTGGTVALACCDVYSNEYGDWVGCIAGQSGVDGNFSADPLYCGWSNPEEHFALHADSPCAPGNSGGCGVIGAFGVGCVSTPVERATWGVIKATYR